jgi:predicted SprT family Zn-dependent metalloprotease
MVDINKIIELLSQEDKDIYNKYKVKITFKTDVWKLLGMGMFNKFSTTLGNQIYLSDSLVNETNNDVLISILTHELNHVLLWKTTSNYNIRYIFDKKFRWQMERACYKKQLSYLKAKGYSINKNDWIQMITNSYFGMCTVKEVEDLLIECGF